MLKLRSDLLILVPLGLVPMGIFAACDSDGNTVRVGQTGGKEVGSDAGTDAESATGGGGQGGAGGIGGSRCRRGCRLSRWHHWMRWTYASNMRRGSMGARGQTLWRRDTGLSRRRLCSVFARRQRMRRKYAADLQ